MPARFNVFQVPHRPGHSSHLNMAYNTYTGERRGQYVLALIHQQAGEAYMKVRFVRRFKDKSGNPLVEIQYRGGSRAAIPAKNVFTLE